MTTSELHEILDDENKKISLKEFREILFQLENDCVDRICENVSKDYNRTYFMDWWQCTITTTKGCRVFQRASEKENRR